MISPQSSPAELSLVSMFSANVLSRYQIDTDSVLPISEYREDIEIEIDFLLDVIGSSMKTQSQNVRLFKKYPIATIVEFLKRSHTEYLEKRIPQIELSLELLTNGFESKDFFNIALHTYFSNYKKDLIAHIKGEEAKFFPYAVQLAKKTPSGKLVDYSAEKFLSEHSHANIDITLLRKLFETYQPDKLNESPYRVLQQHVEALSADMAFHELLEDHVLVVKVMELEVERRRRP